MGACGDAGLFYIRYSTMLWERGWVRITTVKDSTVFSTGKSGAGFYFWMPPRLPAPPVRAATPDNMRLSNMAGGEGAAFRPICAEHRHMRVSCQGAWLAGNKQ